MIVDPSKFAPFAGKAPTFFKRPFLGIASPLVAIVFFVLSPNVVEAQRMQVGGNLESLVDWSTAWVFKDCFKMARTWLTRSANGNEWESNQTPLTDADGWPLAVPFMAGGSPQILHTLLPLYGPGTYTVRLRGAGRVDLIAPNGGGRQVITTTGGITTRTFVFNPALEDNMLYLEVRESSGTDPIGNIEIIAPGQDGPELHSQPFHPDFVASLAPYRVLRFMDWLKTNTSYEAAPGFAQRSTLRSYTQTRAEGVAHEYIIALANETGKSPWICIPHGADDDYVRQTARLYRDHLDPSLRVYVEYSNETWNSQFVQTDYAQDRGQALWLDADRWQAGQKFTSYRSGQIFSIFAAEYGAAQRSRFVAVLATQAANVGLSAERIAALKNPAINPSGVLPDVLAIAPYFGMNFEPGDAVPTAEAVVTSLSVSAISQAAGWTRDHRALADENGLDLICYEGGQHFVGIFGAENNSALTDALLAANRDARMESRYREYLDALEREGAQLFVNFTHVGQWSRFGSWGVLEYQQQSASDSPKWRAISTWPGDASALPVQTTPVPPSSGSKKQTLTFRLPARMVYDGSYILRARATSRLDVTYQVDDPSVARIDGNKLTILKAAPFTVTARQNGDSVWAAAGPQVRNANPAKKAQRIYFKGRGALAAGQQYQVEELFRINSPLLPSIESSNPEIVRVDGTTITALRAGRATLTASQEGDGNYAPAKTIRRTVAVK